MAHLDQRLRGLRLRGLRLRGPDNRRQRVRLSTLNAPMANR
jgi:hypothetical protein